MRTVKVGDRDITVEEPSIYKTELIGDKLAAIGKDAPEIQIELAKFVARYEKENAVVLDRASAKVRVPHLVGDLTEEDWKSVGNQVRLPRSPSGTEQVLAILPTVFTKAREQALEIVAILVVENSALEDEARLKDEIKKTKRFLRLHAKPSQLISLLSECTEVVKEVLEAHKEELGKLRSFWASISGDEPQDEHEAALKEVEETLGATGASPSSTDSPPDTAGDTTRSSTASQPATSSTSWN